MTRGEAFDLARVVFWVILTFAAWALGWLHILAFTALLSIWALVETAWAAYRAGDEKALRRIEEKLDRLLNEKEGAA